MANTEVGAAYVSIYPQTDGNFSKQVGASIGDGVTSGFSAKAVAIGNIMGNIAMKAASAAGEALGDLLIGAFENGAEFEQLAGGVEKIFDEADISGIMADAKAAYKDLNMSANQYLASINQVGATFAQTMGDQKGYETARIGMLAIADYASGTGRNLDELNDKFSLITRSTSSYQSIADQFSGILPATSADFLEQAQAAGFLADEYQKLTDVPVAEYQEAVALMLEKGVADMGLANNAAMESTETISGSINMMKAAWENWLTALSTGEMDVEEATKALVESIGAVLKNAIPAIGSIVESLGSVIQDGLGQIIGEENAAALFQGMRDAVQFLADAFKPLGDAFARIAEGVGPRLQGFCTAIQPFLAGLGDVVGGVLTVAFEGLAAAITVVGDVISYIWDNILAPFGQWISETFGPILEGVGGFLGGVGNAMGGAMDAMSGTMTYSDAMVQSMAGDWQAAAYQATQQSSTMEANVTASMASSRRLRMRSTRRAQPWSSR